MEYFQNLVQLKKNLRIKDSIKSVTHNKNNAFEILPFPTGEPERARFEEGFNGVIGEFVRLICDKKLVNNLDNTKIIANIIDKVQVSAEDKPYLEKLIKQYVTNSNNSLMIFHPSIFKYLPLNKYQESKGEQKIAHFLRDIFCKHNDIRYMFEKVDVDNVISKLILDSFENLEYRTTNPVYENQLSFISELFIEDVTYLFSHREYFLNKFHLLVAYYYFFYITQVSLKLDRIENANYDEISQMYYILDWEKASKTRQSYKKGYPLIKEANKKLIVHVNTLEHLNVIFGTQGKNYVDLENKYNLLDESEQDKIVEVLKIWIAEYRENMSLKAMELENKNYNDLVHSLNNSLDSGIKLAIKSRYALSVKAIGTKYFLKRRGSYLLNMNQEILFLLTSICVKNERKSVKELFKEYERRGVFFDRYSKELIVELFDKLNMIEKISDSGDAQYVKPIL